jgi:hypothetical protein
MKIVDIFVVIEDSLYAVKYDIDKDHIFAEIFREWNDVEYLEAFFEQNRADLQRGFWGEISVEEAVLKTLSEARRFENQILKCAKNSETGDLPDLESALFIPLYRDIFSNTHIESKAYGINRKSWLRLYAIRIADNVYVVSGAGIKLTETMNDRPHLKTELKKLKAVSTFLKKIDLIEKDEIGFIDFGNYEED